MALFSAVTAAVMVGLVGCDSDPIVRDLTPSFNGLSFTAAADSGATRPITDTLVTQDTAFIVRVDTILAPPDTVFVSVTDTVVVGTDTTFVSRTDTIIRIDTIFLPGATDTLVTYDTVVVVQQVAVIPNVATSTSSLSITVGQTVQLNATLENTLGMQATSSNITWRSFNPQVAAITSSGQVSGVAVGQTDIQARDTARGLFEELPVNVTQGQATQTFSGSTGGGPHEPLGFIPITERNFSASSQAGWWLYDPNALTQIVQDVTAPTSGDALAMRVTFPGGWPGGGEPAKLGIVWPGGFREVYASFWFKVSSNWQGHPTGVNKILFFLDESFGGGGDPAVLILSGAGSDGLFFEIRQQGPLGSRNLVQNVGTVNAVRGSWYYVEVLLRMNTSTTASDGEAHLWVNDVKTTEFSNMQWSDQQRLWTESSWTPVWGGVGGTVSNTMHQYMDYIYMSGR